MSIQEEFVIMASQQDYGKLKIQLLNQKKLTKKLQNQRNSQKKQNGLMKKQLITKDMLLHQLKCQLKQRSSSITYLTTQIFKLTSILTEQIKKNQRFAKQKNSLVKQIQQLKNREARDNILVQRRQLSQKNQELKQTIQKMKQQIVFLKYNKESNNKQIQQTKVSTANSYYSLRDSNETPGQNNSESPSTISKSELVSVTKQKMKKLQQDAKRYKRQRDQAKQQYNQLYQTNQGLFRLNQDLNLQRDKLKLQLKSMKGQQSHSK